MIGRHHWRFSLPLVLAAVGSMAAGCSQSSDELPREAVSGTVTLDGEPLANGTIQFSSDGAGGSGGALGGGGDVKDGQFSISRELGLVPGKYRVAVNAAGKRTQAKAEEPGKRSGFAPELIPSKYNSKTTLSAEVKKGGSPDLKFDLQSK
jgi:predicted outer membrane repeat protein